MELLPENVGCPQCGSTTAKRWRSYSGVELCTDCEWDYFAELNTRKLLDARSRLQEPVVPKVGARLIRKSGQPVPNPLRVRSQVGHHVALGSTGSSSRFPEPQRRPDDFRCKVKWIETMEKLITPGFNSLCLLCSHIFYGAKLERCSRCGGLTQQVSDHDLGLMGRHGQHIVEAEQGWKRK